MRLNVKKCVLLFPIDREDEALGILLAGEQVPVARSFRYLGVERAASGILFSALLERKVGALNGSLAALKAAGYRWRPAVRLATYKTFSLSHLDYGGALLSLALDLFPFLSDTPAFSSLLKLHATAVSWITSITHTTRTSLASALTGLASPPLRLSHLSLGLALHLDKAPPHNPAALVVRGYRQAAAGLTLPSHLTPSFPLLAQLAFLPLHRSFLAARDEALSTNTPPPSRHSFIRQSTLSSFSSRSLVLNSYILPSSRPNGLVDGVIRIRDAQDYRRARQWRSSTFVGHLRCIACGGVFSRGHASHMWLAVGAFDEEGAVEEERLESARERVEQIRQERQQAGLASGTFDLLDFLLGHKREDLAEIGYVTLRQWERRMEEFGALLSSFR